MHVFYICTCICSAQLSMFDMERHSRNIIIVIIIVTARDLVNPFDYPGQ